MSGHTNRPAIALTPAELQALAALWLAGWTEQGVSALADVRARVRRRALSPEFDGLRVTRRLEYARWRALRGLLNDEVREAA